MKQLFVCFWILASGASPSLAYAESKKADCHNVTLSANADLLRGVERARRGDIAGADPLLRRASTQLVGADRSTALRYLAFNAGRRGDLRQAATLGERALADPKQPLTEPDYQEFRQDIEAWKAFAAAPTQRVAWTSPAGELRPATNPNKRPEVLLEVGDRSWQALLDTGAERTVISVSMARALGLRPLPALLHDTGSTGVDHRVRLAVLPRLVLGPATITDMPVEIFDDGALRLGASAVDMVLGYETLRLLRAVTLWRDGRVMVGAVDRVVTVVAPLVEDGLVPVLRSRINGHACELLLDTGANTTILTQDFYKQNSAPLKGGVVTSMSISGAGGSAKRRKLTMPHLTLTFPTGQIELSDVTIFPDKSPLDVTGLVGNAGRDLWKGRDAVTIDFEHYAMRM